MLINRREKVGIKKLKKSKAFIDYSQTSDDVYENLEDYNPTQKGRVLIVFDYMITDTKTNKKLTSIVAELFLRGRKLNILLVLYHDLISKCLKLCLRLNETHYFIMNIPNKKEPQQIPSNNLMVFVCLTMVS